MSSNTAGFASRYATALFECADGAGVVDAVAKDMSVLADMLAASPALMSLIASPVLSRNEQRKAITAVLEKAGGHALLIKFVSVVASNGRLFALPDMIKIFLADLARRRGEVSAEIVSAVALDAELKADIEKTVRHIAGSDKVVLSMRVDESLIGGLVVRIGSRMIDTSIRTKLNRLEMTMKGVG